MLTKRQLAGRKAAETIKKKYGADFFANAGAKGGKAKVPKGFALMDRAKLQAVGSKGGRISKRPKSELKKLKIVREDD